MILKREDPVVTELERIVKNELAIPCEFVYANLGEVNYGLDKMEATKFPLFLFIANDRSQNRMLDSGLIIRTVRVVGMMLTTSQEAPTVEYSSKDMSPFIEEMRQLADNLVHRLTHSSMTYKLDLPLTWTADKLYERFDAHLFGVGLEINWPINTQSSGCHR